MASPASTCEYLAPYYPLPTEQLKGYPVYLIYLRKGHTLEKHLEAIGETVHEFKLAYQSFIIRRDLEDQEDKLDQIRKDPGVEKVLQLTKQMAKVARKEDRTVAKQYGVRTAPGFFVSFADPSYTMERHFEYIGERFDKVIDLEETGYWVDVPEAKLAVIFSDPAVALIRPSVYGKFC